MANHGRRQYPDALVVSGLSKRLCYSWSSCSALVNSSLFRTFWSVLCELRPSLLLTRELISRWVATVGVGSRFMVRQLNFCKLNWTGTMSFSVSFCRGL